MRCRMLVRMYKRGHISESEASVPQLDSLIYGLINSVHDSWVLQVCCVLAASSAF
jgi:hypothetical protein